MLAGKRPLKTTIDQERFLAVELIPRKTEAWKNF
jgi:hypothetical protein